jgi:hypothetical protein
MIMLFPKASTVAAAFATVLALGLGLPASGQAQILKCVDAKGNVEFSNQSCQKGWTRQELTLKDNTVNSSGAREQALILENQRLKEQLEKQQAQTAASASAQAAPAPLTEADLAAQRLKSADCDNAARRYEIAAGSIAPAQAVIAARRSAMFAACGIREPDGVNINTNVLVDPPRPCLRWGWRTVQSRITGQVQYVRACLIVG